MSEMDEAIFNSKPALPNKLLNEDGTTTTITGETVIDAVAEYGSKPALPNKFLNPDGSYSTLSEIVSKMVDTSIFVIVDELPASGNPQKIYLVPDGEGGFIEYHWTGSKWDEIGAVSTDMVPQVLNWTGNTDRAGLNFWNNVKEMNKTLPLIILVTFEGKDNEYICHLPTNYLSSHNNVVCHNYKVYLSRGSSGYSMLETVATNVTFTITSDTITNISMSNANWQAAYLDTQNRGSGVFIPSREWEPATKKYVDDSIAASITDAIGGAY